MLTTKNLSLDQCAIKFAGNDSGVFEGYASIFGNVDSHGDIVQKGAYAHIKSMPAMLLNHDWGGIPIGKFTAMSEDSSGLHVKGELTLGVSAARDVYAAMQAGTLDGLSVGGFLKSNDYTETNGVRSIQKWTTLKEISVVTFPANDVARIANVKSEDIGEIKTIRDFETFLRDAGLSKEAALKMVATAKNLFQRDADVDEQVLAQRISRIKSFLI